MDTTEKFTEEDSQSLLLLAESLRIIIPFNKSLTTGDKNAILKASNILQRMSLVKDVSKLDNDTSKRAYLEDILEACCSISRGH